MEYSIEVSNLCKDYSDFSLKNISFALPKGCIMGFIGENGAGKTTSIKAVLDIVHKKSGDVKILGQEFSGKEKEIKERIGVVFDESHFHEELTPKNISKILSGIYKTFDKELFIDYLVRFNLPYTKKIKEFSRGMKMKFSIAAALSHKPELLILDEPTSGLDPVVREEILDIFLDFIQDENHSILISSHITSDLDKIADYITFIHEGRIILSEPRDELISSSGILKCGEDDLSSLDKSDMIKIRRNQFGCEVLIKNRQSFMENHPDLVVDTPNIESIMLMYIKGDSI